MIATIELETLTTQQCRECRNSHLIRAEVVTEAGATRPVAALVGFFGACPRTGERVWLVVQAPDRPEPVRLARFGPIDDESWEPDQIVAFEPPTRPSTEFGSPILPPSGTTNGGFRVAARTPDLLRLAWGCPFSS